VERVKEESGVQNRIEKVRFAGFFRLRAPAMRRHYYFNGATFERSNQTNAERESFSVMNNQVEVDHQDVATTPPSVASQRQETQNGGSATENPNTATVTLTETAQAQQSQEVLTLTLRARPTVTWDESVVDNEGMGRKSSKRCCIFHKQRAFGESSTDSSDYDSDRSGSSTASGGAGDDGKKPRAPRKYRKIARPKNDKKVPDYQRYHA